MPPAPTLKMKNFAPFLSPRAVNRRLPPRTIFGMKVARRFFCTSARVASPSAHAFLIAAIAKVKEDLARKHVALPLEIEGRKTLVG